VSAIAESLDRRFNDGDPVRLAVKIDDQPGKGRRRAIPHSSQPVHEGLGAGRSAGLEI